MKVTTNTQCHSIYRWVVKVTALDGGSTTMQFRNPAQAETFAAHDDFATLEEAHKCYDEITRG